MRRRVRLPVTAEVTPHEESDTVSQSTNGTEETHGSPQTIIDTPFGRIRFPGSPTRNPETGALWLAPDDRTYIWDGFYWQDITPS